MRRQARSGLLCPWMSRAARALQWGAEQVCLVVLISRKNRRLWYSPPRLGLTFAIVCHEHGIASKRVSSSRADCVPALCTHRPSLLPIGERGEAVGWAACKGGPELCQTAPSRGRRSRNTATVGEPAVGSLLVGRANAHAHAECCETRHWAGRRARHSLAGCGAASRTLRTEVDA